MKRSVWMVTALGLLLAGQGKADLITFSGLTNPNLTPFATPYTEGLFTVIPTSGTWYEGQVFGNPVPSLVGTVTSTVEVTRIPSGLFTFSQVDLADALSGGDTYVVEGLLGGSPVFSASGTLPAGFTTVLSPDPGALIDTLRITEHQVSGSFNIDNINVTPAQSPNAIPEPSSLVLFGIAAVGAVGHAWRRRKQAA